MGTSTRILTVAATLGLFFASSAFAWTFSFDETAGTFSDVDAVSGCTSLGTYSGVNKFRKKTITGGTCSVNKVTSYSLSVPGINLQEPTKIGDVRFMSAVESRSGCPSADNQDTWNGNWVVRDYKRNNGITNVNNSAQVAGGAFSWSAVTGTMSVGPLYNAAGSIVSNGYSIAAPCVNGVVTLSGAGDQNGTLSMTGSNGGQYVSARGNAFLIVPEFQIPAGKLDGDYSGWNHDSRPTQTIQYAKITISGTSGTVWPITDVDLDTLGSTLFSVSNLTYNSPRDGMITFNITKPGGATKAGLGIVQLTPQGLLVYLVLPHPDNDTAQNMVFVSRSQPIANGSLDTYSFAVPNGYWSGKVGASGNEEVTATAIFPDGRIVMVGPVEGNAKWGIAMFYANGSLVSNFGTGGKVTTDIASGTDIPRAVVTQSDGKILVGGEWYDSTSTLRKIALARYNYDGTLDTSYGTGGIAKPENINGRFAVIMDLAIDASGKAVAAVHGTDGSASDEDFLAFRFTTTGILDTTFSVDGIAVYGLGSNADMTRKILIQPSDGKIVLAGKGGGRFGFVRFTSAGGYDTPNFGSGTNTTVQINGTKACEAYSAVLAPNGDIIAVGTVLAGTGQSVNSNLALTRLNSAGTLITSFGSSGVVNLDIRATLGAANANDFGYGISLDSSGKIYVIAKSETAPGNNQWETILLRFTSAGVLDTTFDGDGIKIISFANYSFANTFKFQGDTMGVFAGGKYNGTTTDFYLGRFWP